WKGPGTVVVEYTAAGGAPAATLERRLTDPSWRRVVAPGRSADDGRRSAARSTRPNLRPSPGADVTGAAARARRAPAAPWRCLCAVGARFRTPLRAQRTDDPRDRFRDGRDDGRDREGAARPQFSRRRSPWSGRRGPAEAHRRA